MATNDFAWIYLLIFIIIPLARLIPRLLRRRNMSHTQKPQSSFENPYNPRMSENVRKQNIDESRFQTSDMRVLAQLGNGVNKFEKIQKNTNLTRNELNTILEQLEKDGLMQVKQKNGPFGKSIELHLTAKGTRKFHS